MGKNPSSARIAELIEDEKYRRIVLWMRRRLSNDDGYAAVVHDPKTGR